MERHRLVVGHVAPSFAFAGEQFRVETPGDDGVDDDVVAAVHVVFFGDDEELAGATAIARSEDVRRG